MYVLWRIIVKEFLQLRQDRRMIPIIFVAPVVQLVIFGFQRNDLARCLDTLLAEAAAGRAFWRVYRQFKMYNDAQLNPHLRARR